MIFSCEETPPKAGYSFQIEATSLTIEPILSQKVRLNGFMLEFLWLHIFYFDKYYKNNFSPKKLQFYKLKNSISKDIKYYRLMVINELKKK